MVKSVTTVLVMREKTCQVVTALGHIVPTPSPNTNLYIRNIRDVRNYNTVATKEIEPYKS